MKYYPQYPLPPQYSFYRIRFWENYLTTKTLFSPYSNNKTTLVAEMNAMCYPTLLPYYHHRSNRIVEIWRATSLQMKS